MVIRRSKHNSIDQHSSSDLDFVLIHCRWKCGRSGCRQSQGEEDGARWHQNRIDWSNRYQRGLFSKLFFDFELFFDSFRAYVRPQQSIRFFQLSERTRRAWWIVFTQGDDFLLFLLSMHFKFISLFCRTIPSSSLKWQNSTKLTVARMFVCGEN